GAFDAVVAVYTGDTLSTLTPVAGAYDTTTSNHTGRLSFAALAGTSYRIVVASKSSAVGLILLNIGTVPDSDTFASALVLTGTSPSVATSNINASRESGEPRILGQAGGRSVWFKWTAPSSGKYQASAYSLDFDPIMAVYTGSTLAGLTLVAANDNPGTDGGNTSPLCTFNAVAGTTYRISVDSKDSSSSGQITLSLADSAWQYVTSSSITNSPAVGPDGTVYLCEGDRLMDAIGTDGALKWSYDTTYGQDTASVTVADDGTVLVPSRDGFLYALRADGSLRWKYDTGSWIFNSPAIASDGTVYFKAGDGAVYAVSLSTGSLRWSYATGSTDTYAGPVIGSDGTVYVGGGDQAFHAISASGARLWHYPTDQDVYTSAAIDSSGNVYFGTTTGAFYSLTSNGALRWSRSFPPSITSSPAISADGTVYFAGYDHKLHALNGADGSDRWAFTLGNEVRASSPVVADDGTIYIGCYDGKLYAVNAD
ncbi:MAG: PQQ-binding-like beta-propeller repeat protein, partial [Opitutaceae bacterium]